jgi:cytochrome c biogenesis protein
MSDTTTDAGTDTTADGVIAGSEDSDKSTSGGRKSGPAPRLGLLGGLRYLWTQLTTMRTALILLFGLALGAIPGSVVPQRGISPVEVSEFIEQHPRLGPIYDTVGLFNVYTSPWFSAIYILLFVSLIGCIIPRTGVYLRALRAKPPRTPRHLHRLPVHLSRDPGAADPEELIDEAAALLRSRRYRVAKNDDGSLSAERGYLREAGNLLFHISLVVLLIGIAVFWLFSFRGSSAVVVGNGFANNLAQYDDFRAGPLFGDTALAPFSIKVNNFDARFETGDVQRGAAREFRAEVTVIDRPGTQPHNETLEVNHPLTIGGSTVHMIAWGYAPVITVKDGNGDIAYSGPVIFLPQDGNFTSAGAIKAPDARPDRLGFEGLFLPSAVLDPKLGPRSVFPEALNPELYLNAWSGPPTQETGRPESVYSLDTTGLTQLRNPKQPDQPLRFILRPGYVQQLPDGKGTIQMDGVQRWVKLQVSDAPGAPIAIGAIAAAVLGLCFSLFIRPRRVWARVRTTEGSTVFEIAGLDRADARTGLDDDLADITADLGLAPVGQARVAEQETR